MEKIVEKYQQWLKALKTLEKMIDLYKKVLNNPPDWDNEITLGLRDSLIQRFEYCFELTWKYLQVYLVTKEGVGLERNSPNHIFKKSGLVGIITALEVEKCLEMIESRNMTSHIYKEEFADVLAKIIPSYFQLMMIITEKAKVE